MTCPETTRDAIVGGGLGSSQRSALSAEDAPSQSTELGSTRSVAPRRWQLTPEAKAMLLAVYNQKLYPDASTYRCARPPCNSTAALIRASSPNISRS
eukprot:6197211-Pleurochrysis_carterae.AAC.3